MDAILHWPLVIVVGANVARSVIFVTHDISEAVYLGDDIYIMKYAPSRFVEHITVDLPIKRTRETKREAHYTQLVHDVEDVMMKVSGDK